MVDATATETHHEGPPGPPARPRAWALHLVAGPDRAREGALLPLEAPLSVGRRGGGATLELDDPKLSRVHLSIERRGALEQFELRDLGSKNGTFVNGQRRDRCTLRRGDVVRMGTTVAVFDVAAAPHELDDTIRGHSAALAELLDAVDAVTRRSAAVLLLGETGTGKELVAARIHARSGREGPLVRVNCGAIVGSLMESAFFGHRKGAFTGATEASSGLLVDADGGTLFLDEVGEMPLALQPKLLRALDSGEVAAVGSTTARHVDLRVVAATNADLRADVESGKFRADLYARLAGFVIEVPPLRRRRVDIVPLLQATLASLEPVAPITLDAVLVERLLLHGWPMNVRELQAAAQALALGRPPALSEPTTTSEEPPPAPPPLVPRGGPSAEELRALLARWRGSVARLAEHFGKERRQVYRWLARHDIDPDLFR